MAAARPLGRPERYYQTVTAEEFERLYAARLGITIEALRANGRIVAPCSCGDEICRGWQMTTIGWLNDYAEMRGEATWTEERIRAAIAAAEVIRAWHRRNDDR